MLREEKIWLADNEAGEPVYMEPKMANRHGLVAGATGTGSRKRRQRNGQGNGKGKSTKEKDRQSGEQHHGRHDRP